MTKVKVKLGAFEVECEGSEEFVKAEVEHLLSQYAQSAGSSSVLAGENKQLPGSSNGEPLLMTTSTIASRLRCSSGTELIIAAATKLTMVDQQPHFGRQEILEEMRAASAYYRETYRSNLSKYLNQLVRDGSLNEVSSGVYALAARVREQVLSTLS